MDIREIVRKHSRLFIVGLLLQQLAAGETQAAKSGTVTGRVLYKSNQNPIQAAQLTLRSVYHHDEVPDQRAESLEDGSFVFKNVKPGQYYLTVEKEGYASGVSSITRPVTVASDQDAHVEISIPKTSSINGRVLTKDGRPIAGVRVGAWTTPTASQPRFKGQVITDQDGAYHFDNLPAGTYSVGLIPATLRLTPGDVPKLLETGVMVHARTFYPNAQTLNDAARLRVGEEQDIQNIDIAARDVRGYCVTAARDPEQDARNLTTVSVGTSGIPSFLGTGALTASTRTFHFCGLEPGDYVVDETVSAADRTSAWFGMETVVIDKSNVTLGTLSLTRAQQLSGQLVIEQGQLRSQPPQSGKVWLDPVDRLPFADEDVFGVPVTDGKILFKRLYPGQYRLHVNDLSPGYYVSEISADGRDGLHQPISSQAKELKIVVRLDGPSLAGSVLSHQPDEDAALTTVTVILMSSDDSGASIFQSQRTDQSGTFQFPSGLPPGRYKIIALTGLGPDDGKDITVVSRFMTAATDLELKPSDSEKVQLKPIKAIL
jgi:hypothetical protein